MPTTGIVESVGENEFFYVIIEHIIEKRGRLERRKEKLSVPYANKVFPEKGVDPERFKKWDGETAPAEVGDAIFVFEFDRDFAESDLCDKREEEGVLRSAKAWCYFCEFNDLFSG